jgi:hypothetical protein
VRIAALLVLVALAAWLRFWGLDQGLPFVMSRPDEMEALRQTAGFPAGDLNPRWFVYPNLFFWVIWLWLEGVLAVRRLVADTPAYADMLATQMATLIVWGRVLAAALGTATVVVVFVIGRRLGGTALGLVAALLLATNYLHVRDSHGLKADVPLALAVTVCLAALARWAARRTTADAVRAGVAVGVATGIKYPGMLLLATGLQADWLARTAGDGWRRLVPSARFWLFVAMATVTFLCASPYLLVDTDRLTTTFTDSVRAVYGPGRPGFTPPADAPWWVHAASWVGNRTFAYHARVSLRWGCGIAFAVLAPLACLRAWRQAHPFWPLAVGFAAVYYAVISLSQVTLARYFTPLVPLLALAVADLLLAVSRRLPAPALAAAALAAAVAAEPLARAIAHDRVAAETDTRVLATRWMAQHLPPDAVVAVLGSIYFPIADPEVPPPRRRAQLRLGETNLEGHGVTHVVVHEHQLNFSHPLPAQMAVLKPRLTPLVEFSPYGAAPAGWFEELDAYYIPFHHFDGVERPGPEVRIYALQRRAAVEPAGAAS